MTAPRRDPTGMLYEFDYALQVWHQVSAAPDYLALMRRVSAWEQSATARERARAEAEAGIPFHGCVWHNAALAAEAGRPWADVPARFDRIKARHDYNQGLIWAEKRRLDAAFYARYLKTLGCGGAR